VRDEHHENSGFFFVTPFFVAYGGYGTFHRLIDCIFYGGYPFLPHDY